MAMPDPALVTAILAWVTLVTGWAEPVGRPVLMVETEAALHARVCPDTPCPWHVHAAYHPGSGVHLNSALDWRSPLDQSVLVHELVHWRQDQRVGLGAGG